MYLSHTFEPAGSAPGINTACGETQVACPDHCFSPPLGWWRNTNVPYIPMDSPSQGHAWPTLGPTNQLQTISLHHLFWRKLWAWGLLEHQASWCADLQFETTGMYLLPCFPSSHSLKCNDLFILFSVVHPNQDLPVLSSQRWLTNWHC